MKFLWLIFVPALAHDLVDLAKYDATIQIGGRPDSTYKALPIDPRLLEKQPVGEGADNGLAGKEGAKSVAKCVLKLPVARALSRVQANLRLQGLGLKVYDCYRPLSEERNTAEKGFPHSRGTAVHVALVDRLYAELDMPTTNGVVNDYSKGSRKARKNLTVLKKAMGKEAFVPSETAWWHFEIANADKFSPEDIPLSAIP